MVLRLQSQPGIHFLISNGKRNEQAKNRIAKATYEDPKALYDFFSIVNKTSNVKIYVINRSGEHKCQMKKEYKVDKLESKGSSRIFEALAAALLA
jgi:hypothetical protein